MEKQKGYVVLEVGYEYNDEYYHTGNYGVTYEAPNKVFLDLEKATEEYDKLTVKKLRGEDLGRYGDRMSEICNDGMYSKFVEIFKTEFDKEIEDKDYEIIIPEKSTDEQISMIVECLKIEFFKIIEIEIE